MNNMDAMDFLKKYVDAVHPKTFRAAIASEAKKDDAKLTFLHVVLISLFSILALVAYTSLYLTVLNDIVSAPGAEVPPEITVLKEKMLQSVTPISLFLNFITSIAGFYLVNSLLFFICRQLGGNGKLGNQLYVTSLIMVSISVAYALVMFLSPMLSCLVVLPMLMLTLYSLYLTYLALRAVHTNLSAWKTAAAMLVQVLVIIVCTFVLGRIFSG